MRQCCTIFFPQSENCAKTQTIQKQVHSKISLGHIKCSFDEPAESSYRTPKTFFLNFGRTTWIFSEEKINLTRNFSLTRLFLTKVRKHFDQFSKKLWKFFRKSDFPQKPFVHINCSCDNFFEAFSPKSQNNFLTARRLWKNSKKIVEKTVQSKISSGHIECSFDKHIANFSPKVRTDCARRPKLKRQFKEFVFRKNSFKNIPRTLENSLDNPRRINSPKIRNNSSKSDNNWKIWRFREKENYFFKNVLWTQTKHFWPPCQKTFTKFQTFTLKVR